MTQEEYLLDFFNYEEEKKTPEGIEKIKKFITNYCIKLNIKGLDNEEKIKFASQHLTNDEFYFFLPSMKYYEYDSYEKVICDHTRIFNDICNIISIGRSDYVHIFTQHGLDFNIKQIKYDRLTDISKKIYHDLFIDDEVFETGKIAGFELPEFMNSLCIASIRLDREWMIRIINEMDTLERTYYIYYYIDNIGHEDVDFIKFLIECDKLSSGELENILNNLTQFGYWDSFELFIMNDILPTHRTNECYTYIHFAFKCTQNSHEKIWSWIINNIDREVLREFDIGYYWYNNESYLDERCLQLFDIFIEESKNPVSVVLSKTMFYGHAVSKEYLIKLLEMHHVETLENLNSIFYHIIVADAIEIYDIIQNYGLFEMKSNYLDENNITLLKYQMKKRLLEDSVEIRNEWIIDFLYDREDDHIYNLLSRMKQYHEHQFYELITKNKKHLLSLVKIDMMKTITFLVENDVDFDNRFSEYIHSASRHMHCYEITYFQKNLCSLNDNEESIQLIRNLKQIIDIDFLEKNYDGWNSLHMALCFNNFHVTKYLIEEEYIDYTIQTKDGFDILELAIATACSEEIIDYLFDKLHLRPNESFNNRFIKTTNIESIYQNDMMKTIRKLYKMNIPNLELYYVNNKDIYYLYKCVVENERNRDEINVF